MKFLIVGNGYLGNRFLAYLSQSGEETVMSQVDATDYGALKQELQAINPDVLINCAGITGKPNIDWCEEHKMETMIGNVFLPLNIARVAQELGLYWAHIGSGCIYEGDNNGRGFTEEDTPNFTGSFYSKTKLLSEQMLKEFPVLILRLRIPLDTAPSPKNLINKLVNYKTVIEVDNSITVVPEFVATATRMIQDRRTGIYNMTNPGVLRYSTLLNLYKETVDPSFEFTTITLDELAQKTKTGRSNCVLDCTKREAEGYSMKPIEEALPEILQAYKAALV